MGERQAIPLSRAALLEKMQAPLRAMAQKKTAISAEFCAEPPNDAESLCALWLQSVTDGSEAYQAYMASPLCKCITQDVLLRDKHTCQCCLREAEVVHHRNYHYEVMAGLDDDSLISLCAPCHRHIHFDVSYKTAPHEWEKRLKQLQKFYAKKRVLLLS